MAVRRARAKDVSHIQKLVNESAKKNQMMPRSLNDIYENVRDFFVFIDGSSIIGVCALHVMWEDLAEIRSLAVKIEHQGRGIGRLLLRRAIKDAKDLGIKRIFSLTYIPEYFKPFGFSDIDKSELPHKVWGECIRCPQFPECNEHAVILKLR